MEEAKKVIVTPAQESQDAEEILQQAVSESEVRLQVRPEIISDEDQEKRAKEVYSKLSKIDVSKYVRKKNGFDFLPWASCFGILFQHFPSVNFRIVEYLPNGNEVPLGVKRKVEVVEEGKKTSWEETLRGQPFRTVSGSLEVTSEMTVNGITRRMTLPVLNFANKPLSTADTMQINKTEWRCLVKNAALFGLGINVYVGEELPEEEEPAEPKKKKTSIATAAKPAEEKAEPAKPKKKTAAAAFDPFEYKIKGPLNGNKKSVGNLMANLILNATNQKSSMEALNWFAENGVEEDSKAAKELLKMLKDGKIGFPQQ